MVLNNGLHDKQVTEKLKKMWEESGTVAMKIET